MTARADAAQHMHARQTRHEAQYATADTTHADTTPSVTPYSHETWCVSYATWHSAQ